jgi:hypothetical protein
MWPALVQHLIAVSGLLRRHSGQHMDGGRDCKVAHRRWCVAIQTYLRRSTYSKSSIQIPETQRKTLEQIEARW